MSKTASSIRPRSGSEASSAAVGVAAGAGHERGGGDLVAVRLGQPVHRLAEQLGRLVRLVPALVDLAVEPEVGRQVHDLQAALAQLLHRPRRRLVRIGHERGVGALGHASASNASSTCRTP